MTSSTDRSAEPEAVQLPPVADPVPVSGGDTAPDCPACGQAMIADDSSDAALAWFCGCTGDGDGSGPGGGG